MYGFAAALHYAVTATLAAKQAKSDLDFRRREWEQQRWEDEHLLPLMDPTQRANFLAERRRQRERREDIAREERQHRERLAVEQAKALAVERLAAATERELRRQTGWPSGDLP